MISSLSIDFPEELFQPVFEMILAVQPLFSINKVVSRVSASFSSLHPYCLDFLCRPYPQHESDKYDVIRIQIRGRWDTWIGPSER